MLLMRRTGGAVVVPPRFRRKYEGLGFRIVGRAPADLPEIDRPTPLAELEARAPEPTATAPATELRADDCDDDNPEAEAAPSSPAPSSPATTAATRRRRRSSGG